MDEERDQRSSRAKPDGGLAGDADKKAPASGGAPAPGLRYLPWIALLLLLLFWSSPGRLVAAEEIPYSVFLEYVAEGRVRELRIEENVIRGQAEPVAAQADDPRGAEVPEDEESAEPAAVGFHTLRMEDPELVERLEEAGIEYSAVPPSALPEMLSWILPFGLLLLFSLWLFRSMARRAGGGVLGLGKSRARLVPETGTGVTFDDVAGCDEAKAELLQMVEFLRNPSRFTALGAKIPKGVLLLGPPGTGKTLLARAVAGEASVPFFSISGSDFVEMFVGVGAARVRDLFEQAKAKAPCIIFVDEIDAVGRQRGISMGVVNDEREQTLNQLLSEMDGFEENSGVILLAATNRPEILDRALLRPGRFDRQVVLDAPDRSGREAILRVHARSKPLAADVDLGKVAQATAGMSGADLANALNEAALEAAQSGRRDITQATIENAIERVIAGPERRSRRLGPQEKRRVAYHESGHALVAAFSPTADPVQKISIVPRGRAALGYTMQLPEEEHFLKTAEELRETQRVLLAGRSAEILVLGESSTGAQDDLARATNLARQMVCIFGMSEQIGLQHFARPVGGRFLGQDGSLERDCSEATAREIDEEVNRLLDQAAREAGDVLRAHRETLDVLANTLIERETIDRAAFEEILGTPADVAAQP